MQTSASDLQQVAQRAAQAAEQASELSNSMAEAAKAAFQAALDMRQAAERAGPHSPLLQAAADRADHDAEVAVEAALVAAEDFEVAEWTAVTTMAAAQNDSSSLKMSSDVVQQQTPSTIEQLMHQQRVANMNAGLVGENPMHQNSEGTERIGFLVSSKKGNSKDESAETGSAPHARSLSPKRKPNETVSRTNEELGTKPRRARDRCSSLHSKDGNGDPPTAGPEFDATQSFGDASSRSHPNSRSNPSLQEGGRMGPFETFELESEHEVVSLVHDLLKEPSVDYATRVVKTWQTIHREPQTNDSSPALLSHLPDEVPSPLIDSWAAERRRSLGHRAETDSAPLSRKQQLQTTFEEMDLDDSGFIDSQEVSELAQMRRGLYPMRGDRTWTGGLNRALLKKIDTDGNGKIDKSEFVAHYLDIFEGQDDHHFDIWVEQFRFVVQRLHGSTTNSPQPNSPLASSGNSDHSNTRRKTRK